MLIVYNPPNGADIKGFNFGGNLVESHKIGEVKQYEDDMANALVANYSFLAIISSEEAQNLKEKAEAESQPAQVEGFTCPICGKVAKTKLGLSGHMRSHPKDAVPLDIPVAEVTQAEAEIKDKGTEIPDDLKGADWYGDGPEESRNG